MAWMILLIAAVMQASATWVQPALHWKHGSTCRMFPMSNSIIRKSGDYNLYIKEGTLHAEVWPLGTANDSWKLIDGSTSIDAGTWTHIAAVWDGTVCTLYVNGNIDNSTFTNSNVPLSENLYLGMSAIFGQPAAGSMDEVRIWNRALVPVRNSKQ